MALSGKERQQRYRKNVKVGERKRLDVILESEDWCVLDDLAWHWRCTRKEALVRAVRSVWEEEGKPKASGRSDK